MTNIRLGLTYSDVLLVPKRTVLNSRSEADLKTRFTKNIRLNNPLVSANMATVTEHKKLKEKVDVFVEGVANLVDYKGPVEGVIKSILKGIKSGISYCGATNIREMQRKAEFIRITSSGGQESLSMGSRLSE